MIKLKEPYIMLLVGSPLVGKSTFMNTRYDDIFGSNYTLIGRDRLMNEFREDGESENSLFWRTMDFLDKELYNRFIEAYAERMNVVVDMTHLTKIGRNKRFSYFRKYNRYVIIFPFLTMEEYRIRNEYRFVKEKKNIPTKQILEMKSKYVPPCKIEEHITEIFNIDELTNYNKNIFTNE